MKSTPKDPLHPCPSDAYGNHTPSYYEGGKCKSCLLKFDPEDHHYWSDPEFICLAVDDRKHSPEWREGKPCAYCGNEDYYRSEEYGEECDEFLENFAFGLLVSRGEMLAPEARQEAREMMKKAKRKT